MKKFTLFQLAEEVMQKIIDEGIPKQIEQQYQVEDYHFQSNVRLSNYLAKQGSERPLDCKFH